MANSSNGSIAKNNAELRHASIAAGSFDELLGTLTTGPRTQLKTNEPTEPTDGV
jgi:hypothetical protein